MHWTARITEYPEEAGYWSVTRADDIHTVSRDWQTYSSELGGVTAVTDGSRSSCMRAMFIGMDPPKHDRLKVLFQAGFTPKRIAAHEDAIRAIVIDVLDRVEGRETCDLVNRRRPAGGLARDRELHGDPARGRRRRGRALMNSALGAGDPDLNPGGVESASSRGHPGDLRALRADDRRAPRAPDRRPDERPGPRRGRRRRRSRSTRS